MSINDTLAARMDVGETARFFVEPGEYVLRIGRDPYGSGLCAFDADNYTDRETTLRSNETKSFRLFLDSGGTPDIKRFDAH